MKKWIFCICTVLLLAGCTWQETIKPSESLKEARQDYNRGLEYDQAWQFRLAEVYYGKVYRTMKENPAEDWWLYGEAGFRYAHLLSQRGDLEGAVAVLGEVLARAQENEGFTLPWTKSIEVTHPFHAKMDATYTFNEANLPDTVIFGKVHGIGIDFFIPSGTINAFKKEKFLELIAVHPDRLHFTEEKDF